MSATAQELENDVAHMEDRLANVKVVVEVEREAWRRSSHTGKRGTKWKGAAPPHSKEKGATPTTSANILTSDDAGGEITIMPMYWDALELAQYLQTKQLTIYAEVVVNEQITGKLLLDTPATKLRKLFAEVVTIANDPSWKTFQRENADRKLKRCEASDKFKTNIYATKTCVIQQYSDGDVLELQGSCKVFQQSKYKLDPDLYQAHEESFSSCFGATPHNRACGSALLAGGGSRVLDPGRGNLLRLQEFLTVRALHRLSLTSRAWYELITTPSAFCDALWGIHVLRMWRPSEEDDAFLYDVGVLKKPERPRRMLQILTRQVARVTVDNMKVLLSPESWQLATVMTTAEGLGVHSLHKVMARTRDRVTCDTGDSLQKAESRHQQLPAELFEQITAIYTRAGEIVAVCARQLIRPVDPMALLTDILQGIKSGELLRVHCRRLRLFSQTNRLPFDQWALLSPCSRAVVGVFWSDTGSEAAVSPPSTLPVWHQKILTKLQHSLQQRLLGKDSIQPVIKLAHDQNAPANTLLSLEKFLTRCHTHTNQRTAESNVLSDGPPAMGANRFR
ncbi:hypothetical protein BBO99_00008803 [Phytophthora kernoviae]|uniref:Uncharacterized protein n=2 Tax=Phytophthora kernoviae TaxID=325452 RepID=A0A3R7KPW7_9STRA|nr:hypothetical protein G195_010350 [Phytophthora kernoviae 00238/432]KAG2509799.1 hypothetical protein JM16_008640 [Phytophthora kernoviae]KAG2511602.1 hypothetical protein JM18_008369 [Phytophthora kernoviae]RLN26673.1 hypothetical protein BBI17_008826 [Phytophthora kernoviae]RLN74672.1 hypothetical protein BBO99_00008803 [Phytophthora kernoviae]